MSKYFSLFIIFLRFGLLAWGGPVAQIAMIREELVDKRQWVSKDKFNRALALYQALPGPEAHELCVYMGMVQAGRRGGFIAGLGFMLPGFIVMLLLSFLYSKLGASVLLLAFIGVKPAVAALIARAAQRIGTHVLVNVSLVTAGIISIILTLIGTPFLIVFLICGIWQALWIKEFKRVAVLFLIMGTLVACYYALHQGGLQPSVSASSSLHTAAIIPDMFINGLKGGLLSFGGAYTAIPILQHHMVGAYPDLTNSVFLDGIALSSIIPAPLIIFATFLGFIGGGLTGAFAITAGIFLPAFAFTLLGHNVVEKAIEYKPLHGFLDGLSAGVVGLLIVTAVQVILQSVTSLPAAILCAIALLAFYLWKSPWAIPTVMLASGLTGYIYQHLIG